MNKPILEAWRNKGLFYTFRISSQQANMLTFPCPVIAIRFVNSLKHFDVSFNQSRLLSQLLKSVVLSDAQAGVPSVCRLLQGRFLLNFNQIIDYEILIIVVQQVAYIFSILHTNLIAGLNITCLEANDVRKEQSKRRRRKSGITVQRENIQGCIQKFHDSNCKKKFAYLGC